MFIKKLELLGFKTFADKTEIEFSEGITSVVGPNGSGKSNISDSLLWVLGESNIRNIRGQRSTDVIFNGSEKRRALSLAEVSITLDNACGTLPIDFSEVTVTRRTFRNGEAEYFINKARCRLKDIYELFLDTGIGREAYSFVTQGEIDAVLSAKPEDRRELFEEAAGIKKYRYRRQEALRKLERTEANLNRVKDIMAEIGGQLEPLAEQAEQARRYTELQSRLWDIEIGLLIRDLRRFTASLDEAREGKEGADVKIADYDRQLADIESERDKKSETLKQLEEQVENSRKAHQTVLANVQRLESRSALLEERLSGVCTTREQADEDMEITRRRIEETSARIDRLALEESAASENESRARVAVGERTRSLESLDVRHESLSRAAGEEKATWLELAKELAAKRNALQNSRERLAQLDGVLAKYEAEIEGLCAQKIDADARLKQTHDEMNSLRSSVDECASRISAIQQRVNKISEEVESISRRQTEAGREMAAKSSRLATLREMAESHEGFFEGVRSVMASCRSGKLSGSFAVVADVISVPKGYETAVETALGASVQDIITDTVAEAKSAIAFLKDSRTGRATFLPLDNMSPSRDAVRGRLDPREGALGIAADLIEYDRKYDSAIRSLLGRTIVADNIDNAVALSRRLTGWNRVVTLDGEVIVPSGAITGGSRKNRGPELLLRKQEIDALSVELRELESLVSSLAADSEDAVGRLAASRAQATAAETALSDSRVAFAECERRADFISEEIARIAGQTDVVRTERDEAAGLKTAEQAAITGLESELSTVGRENTDLDQKVAGAEQEIEELRKQRAEEREELMKLNVELAACSERALALRNSLKESQRTRAELTASLQSRGSQLEKLSTDAESLLSERDSVTRECAVQSDLLSAAERSLNSLIEKRSAEMDVAAELDARHREIGSARNSLFESTRDAAIREARLEVQVNQCTERLQQEYDLGYEQAMAWPEEDISVERGTASEVARLRKEIKDMGVVNTGAVQEYDRIKERWDFLTAQRADLDNARDQINSAIREIDSNTRGLFIETFNTVGANFDLMFKRLFGGGKTELSLTDSHDLLNTGIDIVVQPPGKKMQDMALLSGGERALTATALIFALLLAKPSPFVVMDEVDAPLDESNVERFAEVLKEFAAKSQFIVVTHNRATMEAADSLYGVTMQEPGVSKLISVKLSAEGPIEKEVELVDPSAELANV